MTAAKQYPPGPKGVPWFGCLGEMRKNPMAFFTRISREYGGIARIPLGRDHVYLVSGPELLKELLVDNRSKYTRNVRYKLLRRGLGEGLLTNTGEVWKRQRRLSQPALKPAAIDPQVEWMSEVIAGFLDEWEAHADSGEALDFEPEFSRLIQLVSGIFVVGPSFEDIAGEFFDISEAIRLNWPTAPSRALASYKPPSVPKMIRLYRAFRRLDDIVYELVRQRLKTGVAADGGALSVLMQGSAQEGRPFTERELRDQVITLFFAGHETTASSLCWTHYLLSKHPQARERVIQEVQAIDRRVLTCEHLKALTYTERVVEESLRLYSSVHSFSRVALEDNEIGGYKIPKGATVVVSLYALHRLPQYWQAPEVFDPDRFTPENTAKRARFAYLPFAAGPRNCIGAYLAMVESTLVTAQVAQRFRLDLVPGHPVEPAAGTTMHPRYGLKMTVKRIVHESVPDTAKVERAGASN